MTDLEKIDNCRNILATKIFEPEDNELIIEICLGRVSEKDEDWIVPNKNLGKRRGVTFNSPNDEYQLYFDSYISYLVMNETYDGGTKESNYSGNRIREYKSSTFMDFCKKETLGFQLEGSKNIKHYMIITVNHIINILTTSSIQIKSKE